MLPLLQVSQNEIRQALESSDEDAKVQAMQKAITAILAGEQFPSLFITIVRYVLPSENHMVQKLLLLYLVRGAEGAREDAKESWLLGVACMANVTGRSARAALAGPALPARLMTALHHPAARASLLQETIEKTDAQGKLLPEMVRAASAGGSHDLRGLVGGLVVGEQVAPAGVPARAAAVG